MPSVPHLINEFWSELPEDVRTVRLLAGRRGVPTDSVRIGYFQKLTSVGQRALKGAGFMLGETEAERFRAELESIRDRTVRFARWAVRINQERSAATTSIEALIAIALELSSTINDPQALTTEDAHTVARQAIERRNLERQGAESRAASLERLLRSNAADFERLLIETWSRRPPPPSGRTERGPENKILAGVSWSQLENKAVATEDAQAAWTELVQTFEAGENASDEQVRTLGLSGEAPAVPPALTGRRTRNADEPPGTPQRPLSRNIRARVSAVIDSQAESLPAPPPSLQVIEATIRASPQPFGLPQPSLRAVIHLGARVGTVLNADSTGRSDIHASTVDLPRALVSVRSRWQRAADEAIRRAHQANERDYAAYTPQRNIALDAFGTSDVTQSVLSGVGGGPEQLGNVQRYVDDGSAYMLGRLWTRLLRSSLLSSEPMNADEMWSHVYGSVLSAIKTMKDVSNWRPRAAPKSGSDSLFSRAAQHPQIGWSAVFELWERVDALPARAHLPRDIRQQLDIWAALVLAPDDPQPDIRAIKAYIRHARSRLHEAIARADDPLHAEPSSDRQPPDGPSEYPIDDDLLDDDEYADSSGFDNEGDERWAR